MLKKGIEEAVRPSISGFAGREGTEVARAGAAYLNMHNFNGKLFLRTLKKEQPIAPV